MEVVREDSEYTGFLIQRLEQAHCAATKTKRRNVKLPVSMKRKSTGAWIHHVVNILVDFRAFIDQDPKEQIELEVSKAKEREEGSNLGLTLILFISTRVDNS